MDWSNKASSHLDWDNLALLDAKVSGISKHLLLQQQDFGVENGSVYSWNGAGFSASDLGTGPSGCSSKSSFSTTMDSSSRLRTRISEINFETGEVLPRELDKGTEFIRLEDSGASPEDAPSVVSGEQLLGLKLGKRTYFEDVCAGSHAKTSQLSITPSQPANTIKKSRVSHQKVQSDRCQVEGCNVDLTSAKDYHRKHRVCESHSKCQKVVVSGLERRFCQQCSRFHDLLEFDKKKRSCRRRLSDHNARRRKPPPETFSLSTASLSSSFYDDRQPMNLLFNRVSFGHPRVTETSASWEGCGFKMSQANESYVQSSKAGSVGGEVQLLNNKLPTIISSVYHDADRLVPFKNTGVEVINQGLEASMVASNLDGAPDLRCALSLLSTESWVSPNPGLSTSFDQDRHVNHTGAALPAINMSHASSDTWQVEAAEQLLAHESRVPPFTLDINGNHFQEIQLLKPQYGSAFFNSNQTH